MGRGELKREDLPLKERVAKLLQDENNLLQHIQTLEERVGSYRTIFDSTNEAVSSLGDQYGRRIKRMEEDGRILMGRIKEVEAMECKLLHEEEAYNYRIQQLEQERDALIKKLAALGNNPDYSKATEETSLEDSQRYRRIEY